MEKGQEKIQKICEVLRKETLEPAFKEADAILEEAKNAAHLILAEAEEEALIIIKKAKEEITKERNVFQASLSQAAKQTLETLRQQIENQLFHPELKKLVAHEMEKPQTIADLINVIIEAINKEGLSANLDVVVPKAIPASAISKLITGSVLKDRELSLGNFSGGAKVRMLDKGMTIEITDHVLESLVASYVRKDFRDRLFNKAV